jgi:hypothetical protein
MMHTASRRTGRCLWVLGSALAAAAAGQAQVLAPNLIYTSKARLEKLEARRGPQPAWNGGSSHP